LTFSYRSMKGSSTGYAHKEHDLECI